MGRNLTTLIALALAAPLLLTPAALRANDRTLPMHFLLRLQGPATACGKHCRLLIAASGAITADTPRDFEHFARGHSLAGATVVFDSDGGSVHGAIALGREIRRLGLDTTVGHIVDLDRNSNADIPVASLSARADCESMCAFVLLAGVHRSVPREARVMVHQIWLGDRRDDPTAASYSAEDLVLVQRDIGKLAQYTIDMGASIEVLNLALRIPPWEPMHVMTPTEIQQARVATIENVAPSAATVAASPPAVATSLPVVADGLHADAISERHWAVLDRAGSMMLARRHPLTIEGEDIGSFDLMLTCGNAGNYDLAYQEHRFARGRKALIAALDNVTVDVGYGSATLKVVSSQRRNDEDELVSYAAGSVPASLIDAFGGAGNHSITVETRSAKLVTGIRLGNTGVQQSLPQIAAGCQKAIGDRAELSAHRTGGLAAAR